VDARSASAAILQGNQYFPTRSHGSPIDFAFPSSRFRRVAPPFRFAGTIEKVAIDLK